MNRSLKDFLGEFCKKNGETDRETFEKIPENIPKVNYYENREWIPEENLNKSSDASAENSGRNPWRNSDHGRISLVESLDDFFGETSINMYEKLSRN